MALRIGKKKDAPADDWSEEALLGGNDDQADTVPAAAPTPAVDATSVHAADADPADAFVTDNFDPATPPRRTLSPILLAAGLVMLLTAAGVAAYFLFFNTPPEEDEPVVIPTRVVKRPSPAPAPAAKPPVTPKKQIPVKPAVGAPKVKVPPGRAGIVRPGTTAPGVRPAAGKPPATAPKPNQPTPVPIMPDGIAGQAGKGLQPGNTVAAVQPLPTLTPALKAQLKTLWNQGAAAKWRGDYPAARRAWTRMLQLRPGHPGVQEAINKLPK